MGARKAASRPRACANALLRRAREDDGAVAVYVALVLTVMFGMVGLAIDGSRLLATDSEAKSAADASALAAASQLDQTATAITRATAAAQGSPLITNNQTHANGGAAVTITSMRFFSSLPADTTATISSSFETTDPKQARFVEVTTRQLTRSNSFLLGLVSTAPTATTSATAVAGYNRMVCRFPPLMICNPLETSTYHDFPVNSVRGQQVLAKTKQGGSSAWAPGDFGLLDPPNDPLDPSSNSGAKHVTELIAAADPRGCYGANVNLRPGAVTPVQSGMNVRFDMYQNPYMGSGAAQSNAQYRPARNVVKGKIAGSGRGGACNPTASALAQKMPEDTCLATGTCATSLPTRLGDGVWNHNLYWTKNHPAVSLPTGLATASRYDVYRYEIDNGIIPNNAPSGGENGNPQCYSGSTAPNDSPDRRELYLAVINCIEQGPLTGSSNSNVKVKAFAKMFVTEPVDAIGNVWLEFISAVQPGADDGVLHDQIQLYR